MEIITNLDISYLSEQFGISNKKLLIYNQGLEGEGKKLLVKIICSYDREFIKRIEEKNFKKKENIKYLNIDLICELFDFRKDSLLEWKSKRRMKLKNCLLNTPLVYVEFIKTTSKLEKELKALFP
ncbi:MAG: hypothetical protein EOM78_05155 [Erysipelotrichia bacterium]|nr:hypothetical protein [Erysipelotrichia bacterium]